MEKYPVNSTEITSLKTSIIDFLDSNKLVYEIFGDRDIITLSLGGKNGRYFVLIHFDEATRILQIRTTCPITVNDSQKLKVSELITRLNYELLLGYFIQSFQEGDILYKSLNIFPSTNVNKETIDKLFWTNVKTMDNYLPAIMAVNHGYIEPVLVNI